MAEWSIAAVLKTVEGNTSGGSNPSLSATGLDFQGIAKYEHEYVHETPDFKMISGVFLALRSLRRPRLSVTDATRVFGKSLISHPTDGDSRPNI